MLSWLLLKGLTLNGTSLEDSRRLLALGRIVRLVDWLILSRNGLVSLAQLLPWRHVRRLERRICPGTGVGRLPPPPRSGYKVPHNRHCPQVEIVPLPPTLALDEVADAAAAGDEGGKEQELEDDDDGGDLFGGVTAPGGGAVLVLIVGGEACCVAHVVWLGL